MSEVVVFNGAEYQRIEKILRQVFTIRTIDGEEDELLGDFIDALANGETISLET